MKQPTLMEIAEKNFSLPKDRAAMSTFDLEARLKQMISYAIDRHDWYEEQRGKLFQAALGMLGFIAASVAILHVSVIENSWLRVLFGLSLLTLGFTSIRLIYLYTEVSEKNHPYRKISDIRSWYFRYIVNGNLIDDLDALQCADQKKAAIEDVSNNFKNFLEKFREYVDNEKFILEDLQQVFIIFILQKYRQENLKKMYVTIKVGSIIFGVFGALSIIFSMA